MGCRPASAPGVVFGFTIRAIGVLRETLRFAEFAGGASANEDGRFPTLLAPWTSGNGRLEEKSGGTVNGAEPVAVLLVP